MTYRRTLYSTAFSNGTLSDCRVYFQTDNLDKMINNIYQYNDEKLIILTIVMLAFFNVIVIAIAS